ncbi:NERD domain-containing protein [Rhodospirillum centenum]|uniref:NERD domain-containing protein n=1 Tax=Rhodospirillum centenum (strain ATCC 51521 / SW) TaxID=414684 RepID=B6INU4_RHOCS|nr:NERD domain-containing protein [Rhodospirillum centenum]ACI99278.1 hypothetical protein RC1_1882 [Rhodospirillum centenum SW]
MLSTLVQQTGLSPGELVTAGALALVLAVLVLVLLLALVSRRRRMPSARQYDADLYKRRIVLDELPFEAIHDVRIHDGHGKVLKVDHVLRLPASVLLVHSGPHDVVGPVKANAGSGLWRYVAPGGKVGSFPNPVVRLHPLIQAIRGRFPLVRIRVLTVFPRSADLGPRPPKGTCVMDDFAKAIRDMAAEDGGASPALDAAWDTLSKAFSQASGRTGGRAGANRTGSGTGTAGRRVLS